MSLNIFMHVDMDAFYAAIETRDKPEFKGKPLIVGSLPTERGVVATCNYEARKYGIRSAMNIKEAYARCPKGIYIHPNIRKYKKVSDNIHKIWKKYTNKIEYIALDEAYLEFTGHVGSFSGVMDTAIKIKKEIKEREKLSCSIGIGYSMMSAKLAGEENKPDGLFMIANEKELTGLIMGREVSAIYGIGRKTAKRLNSVGIKYVRDIYNNEAVVKTVLGNQAANIINKAKGLDDRKLVISNESNMKSISREHTFQINIENSDYLKEILQYMSDELSRKLRSQNIYAKTVTLKITYADMNTISRSGSGEETNSSSDIYNIASGLFDKAKKAPIRLIGITVSRFSNQQYRQLSIF